LILNEDGRRQRCWADPQVRPKWSTTHSPRAAPARWHCSASRRHQNVSRQSLSP